jgi:hypothetical protein
MSIAGMSTTLTSAATGTKTRKRRVDAAGHIRAFRRAVNATHD